MSEPISTEAPSTTPPGDGGTGGGTQAPEGFVPLGDLEREQARARSFQSELDRAKAELAARAPAAPTPKAGEEGDPMSGFDPIAYRRSLLADTANVVAMTQAVSDLRTRFPDADPAIYQRLDEFGNADALRLAVEDSHVRVAAIIDARVAAKEAALREEFGEKNGGITPPGTPPAPPAGDPTVEQLNAMTLGELAAFEQTNPGVAERVLRSVS